MHNQTESGQCGKYEIIGKAIQEGIKAGLSDTRLLSDYVFNKKVKEKIEGVSK